MRVIQAGTNLGFDLEALPVFGVGLAAQAGSILAQQLEGAWSVQAGMGSQPDLTKSPAAEWALEAVFVEEEVARVVGHTGSSLQFGPTIVAEAGLGVYFLAAGGAFVSSSSRAFPGGRGAWGRGGLGSADLRRGNDGVAADGNIGAGAVGDLGRAVDDHGGGRRLGGRRGNR